MRSRLPFALLAGILAVAAGGCAPAQGLTPAPAGSPAPAPGTTGPPIAEASRAPSAAGATDPAPTSPPPTRSLEPTPTPVPTPTPEPTPTPSPPPVPAPLTGLLVPPAVAARPVVAVMLDDHADARPQSGLASADVVWQAPAEGGIPRFMALFSSKAPQAIGPVRSARLYFIAWAAEQGAVYVHAGGSPGALGELARSGNGATVWNVEGLAYVGGPFWRVGARWAPHNLYTSSAALSGLAKDLGYAPASARPAFTFAPPVGPPAHGEKFRLAFSYGSTEVTYGFDPTTRTYPRAENGLPTTDAPEGTPSGVAAGKQVAPMNVVVISMPFGPAADGTGHGRLDAGLVGEGPALVFRAGELVKGTWRKTAFDAPTELLAPGPDGTLAPIALVPGRTFVQVVPTGIPIQIRDAGGAAAPWPTAAPPGAPS